jgi:hypothetical protein
VERTGVLAFSLFPFVFAVSSFSQDDEALKKDLTAAVIALHGIAVR